MVGRLYRAFRARYRQLETPAKSAQPAVVQVLSSNEAFFDLEWYSAQTGRAFPTRNAAIDHARRALNRRAELTPHPLYMPVWARTRRQPNTEAFIGLFTPGWPQADPHPLVDLEHVASAYPESTRDPDGVFGWLLKRLAAGEAVQTLPDAVIDWSAVRTDQISAVRESLREEQRFSRWREGRDADHYDADLEAATVRQHTRAPVSGETPVVTVVMPAYNRATQIAAAIESVKAQTLSAWELVVADDGSSDATVDVARQFAASDSRISVLELEHRGVSAARNSAIAASRGRWVAFLDTDNTWVPEYLEVMTGALDAAGADHGYSGLRVEGDDLRTTYRVLDSSEDLDVGNHIDLNVWMVRRECVTEVGMFDESLRRAVDYDLIWRVALLTEPLYVPFIGSNYAARNEGTERITDIESFNWKDVVRSKNLVDWQRQDARQREAGTSAVVVWTGNSSIVGLSLTLRHLARECPGIEEVIVIGTRANRTATVVVHAERQLNSKIREVAAPPRSTAALLANLGFAHTTRSHLVFLEPGITIPSSGLRQLRAAVEEGAVVAQPVVVDPGSVVLHAGLSVLERGTVPSPFLAGHHVADVAWLPERMVSDAASLKALVTSAQAFLRLRGFDALYGGRWFDADYCLRAREISDRPVVTCTRVVAETVGTEDWDGSQATKSAAVLLANHTGLGTDAAEEAWRALPFELRGLERDRPVETNPFLTPPRAVLALAEDRYPDGEDGRLRVAIRHCAPPGRMGSTWGDLYFAHHLADAVTELGHDVLVDNRLSARRPSSRLDIVSVVIRGVRAIHPVPGAVNVLWIISHPDRVKPEELVGFDLVYAASTRWARRASARFGREVRPLLQASDVSTFRRRAEGVTAPQVLFVGNRRAEYPRPAGRGIALATASGIDAGIYGSGWQQDGIEPPVLRGQFVPNDQLPLHYSAADIVLNDHFPTMREQGFINNRIFDALACGTPVLSDRVPEAEEIFGDRVLWYSRAEDIPAVVEEYLHSPWSDEKRAEAAHWVATNHSFAARAATVMEDVRAELNNR